MIIVVAILIIIITVSFLIFYTYSRYLLCNENAFLWENQVRKYESRYPENYPQNSILFIGSSSIKYWKSLTKDMYPLQVLNHGIAGTKISDILYYADRLIFPFKPFAIVIYLGTNDINGIKNNSKTADEVSRLTINFFTKIHDKLPQIPIYYISISPTKARSNTWKDAKLANQLIKQYCEKNENLKFIDTTEMLVDKNGKPKAEIFRLDGLHFNKKGYAIWASVIKHALLKV